MAANESGEYPPELVEFAQVLLSEQNAGVLDRLDKGAGEGGDDGDISLQDVATVLSYEDPPPQATEIQRAQFTQLQLEAIVSANREGRFEVDEFNETLVRVLDNANLDNPAFSAALVGGMDPVDFAWVLDVARYGPGIEADATSQLQKLMAAAMSTMTGERAMNVVLDQILETPGLSSTYLGQVKMILGSSRYGQVPASILQSIADASLDPTGQLRGALNLERPTDRTFSVAYIEALATNPAVALSILEQYPILLKQEYVGGDNAFVAAMDTLLGNLADHVVSSGSFPDARSLGGILDQLAMYGTAKNDAALATAIEQVVPLLAEGIASDDNSTSDIVGTPTLAGRLIEHYLGIVAGDDPNACVDAMTLLLEKMTGSMEITPKAYGTVLGLLTAGMLRHFNQIRMSDENRQAFWGRVSGVLQTAGAASGFWKSSPWGVALGTGLQGIASLIDNGDGAPRDYEAFAVWFQARNETMLLKGEIEFPGYYEIEKPELTAIAWMNNMINYNVETSW